MEKYKNIIFDFDGTLVNTTPLIVATMQATVRELELPQRTDAECKSTIGLRLEEIPSVLWPGNERASKDFPSTYRRIFDELKRPLDVKCFPGVLETMKILHDTGHRMAIASSRSHKSLEEYVNLFGIADYFSMLIGGNDVRAGKPSPEPVITILNHCAWEAAETITVGDAPVDILMGSSAGTATCAVTYGNGKADELQAAHPTYMISSFETLIPIIKGISPDMIDYVEREIITRYDNFDKAHRRDHVRMVITQSLKLADGLPKLDPEMIYCIAAFHDLGLANGRENHHIDSGKILEADPFIRSHFTPENIALMKQAVEDHRASGKTAPRSDYGKIVADADRFIDAETIIRRTVQYGLANYPGLDREGHYERTLAHLTEKYGPDGYLRVWLPWSDNTTRLKKLHTIIADRELLRDIFNRIFDNEA